MRKVFASTPCAVRARSPGNFQRFREIFWKGWNLSKQTRIWFFVIEEIGNGAEWQQGSAPSSGLI